MAYKIDGQRVNICHKAASLALPTNVNGNISQTLLQHYFPEAIGLTFNKDGNTYAVNIENKNLIIEDASLTYDVYTVGETENVRKYSDSTSTKKEQRITDLVNEIRKNRKNPTAKGGHNETTASKKAEDAKKIKKSTKTSKLKTLHVGWLHNTTGSGKYSQMKKPFGGIKELRLDTTKKYTVDDIKLLAIQKFEEDGHSTFLATLRKQIGFYDGTKIDTFETEDRVPCDIWKYCLSHNVSLFKLYLYLLTTVESNESLRGDSPSSAVENSSEQPMMADQTSNNEDKVDKYYENHPVSSSRSNHIENVTLRNDQTSNNEDKVDKYYGNHPVSSSRSNQIDNVTLRNDITILFQYIVESKYTGSLSITEVDKDNLHACLQSRDDMQVAIEEFQPLDFGFKISEISRGQQTLLKIDTDLDLSRTFSFPSLGFPVAEGEHKILYDLDEINGTFDCKFGLGCIPSCTDACKPIFTWYRDKEIYEKGAFRYWVCISETEEAAGHMWSCEVSCSASKSVQKSSIVLLTSIVTEKPQLVNIGSETVMAAAPEKLQLINSDSKTVTAAVPEKPQLINIGSETETAAAPEKLQLINSDCENVESSSEVFSLPIIDKGQITFSRNVLGVGMQGKVREGSWLGTSVAIKSIRVGSSNIKLASRELSVLGYIRHPNIIQTMGICMEPKQLHIVMELVRGNTLSDIIFDEEIKLEYKLDTDQKTFIGCQLCKAISYLHLQANAIIHRDIKPDNILISQQLIVKLCDLGLSKFKHMVTAIRTTIGSTSLKGTPIYMAPELLFHGGEATVYSDIWATACTLVELYTGESIWDLSGEDQTSLLKMKLEEHSLPNFTNIPIMLRDVIEKSLSPTPQDRPLISEILQTFITMS